MAVQGYNVDPESSDSVIGVEIDGDVACVYIDEGAGQTEIHLDWYELKAHIWACNRALMEMEWSKATYAFACAAPVSDTQHLVALGNATLEVSALTIEPTSAKFEKALCGRPAPVWVSSSDPLGWDIDPVLSDDPRVDKICKNCYRKWQKLQQLRLIVPKEG